MSIETTETLLSRTGNLVQVGETSFKVPSDISALSVLSHKSNRIVENCTVEDDGYVYLEGKRLWKWFSYREGWDHFWAPTKSQLKRLGNLAERLERRHAERTAAITAHVENDVIKRRQDRDRFGKCWKATTQVADKKWILYTGRIFNTGRTSKASEGWSYTTSFSPSRPRSVNMQDGTKLHRLIELQSQAYRQLRAVRDLFFEGVRKELDNVPPPSIGRQKLVAVEVSSGISCWFTLTANRVNYTEIKALDLEEAPTILKI